MGGLRDNRADLGGKGIFTNSFLNILVRGVGDSGLMGQVDGWTRS